MAPPGSRRSSASPTTRRSVPSCSSACRRASRVELLRDVALRILPLTDVDAARARPLTAQFPLLFGYRGAPACDVAALEDLLLRVGHLAETLPEVAEMDCNPVIVSPAGAVAVDVKVHLAPERPGPPPGLRRLR